MDIEIIRRAGLTESQAKGYIALIENGPLSANALADKTGESRTNAYAIADKLVSYGLAVKSKDDRAAVYTANHPSSIETLAERRRKAMAQNEKAIKDNINSLIDYFYKHTEMPGVRTLQGLDGIQAVYEDTLTAHGDIYLVRTAADDEVVGGKFLLDYIARRAALGIRTIGLYPDERMQLPYLRDDTYESLHIDPAIVMKGAYTAPVEIDVYDDKLAFIAFGETQMATITQSPPIAEAMRQLLKLLHSQLKYSQSGDSTISAVEYQSAA